MLKTQRDQHMVWCVGHIRWMVKTPTSNDDRFLYWVRCLMYYAGARSDRPVPGE